MVDDDEGSARVTKREFIKRVAFRAGVPVWLARRVYDATIEEIFDSVADSNTVTLAGFGKFSMQSHKGHRVTRMVQKGESAVDLGTIDDYSVLKFSATRAVNKEIGDRAVKRSLDREISSPEESSFPAG